MRFSLSQLPPALRAQAEKQLGLAPSGESNDAQTRAVAARPRQKAPKTPSAAIGTDRTANPPSRPADGRGGADSAPNREPSATTADRPRGKFVPHAPKSVARPPMRDHRGVPNKTEARYNRDVLGGLGRYEAVTLRMPGGNYTPDWMTVDDGRITFHEVKGAFRFGSQSRAILGFKSAAAAFPFWNFVWATLRKGGVWDVKRFDPSADGDPDSEPSPDEPSEGGTEDDPAGRPEQTELGLAMPSDSTTTPSE